MGLLSDLLGSAAIAGGDIMARDNKAREEEEARIRESARQAERQREMADYNSKLQQERDKAAAELKQEMEDAKQKRLIDDSITASGRAEDIGKDRRFQSFIKDIKASGGSDLSDEELRKVFEEQYDDRRVNSETGGDRYQDKGRTAKAGDYLRASQETGNTGLISTALKGVDDARQLDAQTSKEAAAAAELRRKEERDQLQREYEQQRLELLAGKGTSGVSASERIGIQALLNSANKDFNEASKTLREFDKDPMNKNAKAQARRQALVDEVNAARETKRKYEDMLMSAVTSKPDESRPPVKASGDPPKGSGIVSESNITPNRIPELEQQIRLMSEQHAARPTRASEELLRDLDRQLQEARSIKGTPKPSTVSTAGGQSPRVVSIKRIQ